MTLGPLFDDPHESAFQYKSIFRYSKVPGSENDAYFQSSRPQDVNEATGSKFARGVLLCIIYASFVATFPISMWFCIKKIKSLERCIIFRLGQRLPLKGPGLVITFPCVDVVDTIDLNPQTFEVASHEQMLTADGSVVEIVRFTVSISVDNAIKSFTHLKDSKQNVEQFIRLSFKNLVSGTHVEDLERKIDWIIRQFVDNCNGYVTNWGWNMTILQNPTITVVTRAEPSNAIVSALKGYFNGGQKSEDPMMKLLTETIGPHLAPQQNPNESRHEMHDDPFVEPLQSMAGKYSSLSMLGYDEVVLQVEIVNDKSNFYRFSTSSGKVVPIDQVQDSEVQVKITANSVGDFMDSLNSGDTSKVVVKNNLF